MPRVNNIIYSNLNEQDPDSIHFAFLHPADGRALRFHFDEFMSSWIPDLASSLMKGVDLSEWRDYFGNDLFKLFVEQILYLQLVQPARDLFRRDFAAQMGWNWRKQVFIPSELSLLVKKNWPGPAAETIASSQLLSGKVHIKRFIKRFLSWHFFSFKKKKNLDQLYPESMIGVEFVEGADLALKNDVFWIYKKSISPHRIIFILENQNIDVKDAQSKVQYAQSIGAKVVAIDPKLARRLRLPYWKMSSSLESVKPPTLPKVARKSINIKAQRWLFLKLQESGRRVQFWQSFFHYHNITIYQHFTEMSIEAIIRRIAARRADTIEIGRMRSQFFSEHSASFYFQHQIAMVWKKDIADILAKGNTGTEYAIEIGYPYDYMLLERESNMTLKKFSFSSSISVTCVVFDNHPHHDNHITRESLEEFYNAIIAVAESFPNLGLLIKSKKPMILNALPDIKSRLDKLVEHGQCIIQLDINESAAANAIQADIAVGFPGSTAASEAALLGCITLMFDPSGASRFSESTAPEVVFKNIGVFKANLEKVVLKSVATSFQESFRRQLVPAEEHYAYLRASRFLNAYLDARENGKNSSAALKIALHICQDYVIPVGS